MAARPGRIATLSFANADGAPWRISEIAEPATEGLLVDRARSQPHVAMVRARNEIGPANVVVFLEGLEAPVHLDVVAADELAATRVEVRVARPAESVTNAGEAASVASVPSGASVETVIRDYLLANPDVLREALDPKRQLAARAARLREEFLGAPDVPAAGDPDAPITVVEFFDYRCGFCKRSLEAVRTALERSGVRLELREYPILGDDSLRASRLALAADLQGRYMDAHLMLMEREDGFGEEVIGELAGALGLDVARLRADMESAEVQARIDANRDMAARLGVTGTPAFFVAGPERIEAVPGALALLLISGCASGSGGSTVVTPPPPPAPPPPPPAPPPPPPPPPDPETFAGKEALRSRIEAAGGFEGMVAIFDGSTTAHGQGMRRNLIEQGVPADNIAFPELTHVVDILQFELERNADLLARTRVAQVPQHAPFNQDDEPEMIEAHNIVWAVAAGNTYAHYPNGDRDFWRPDHPYWVGLRETNCCANGWENHVKAFETGKVLLAVYAHRDGEGGYKSIEGLVACGEARDACIAIAQPPDENGGTSDASAKLAAAAFYVFQLYERAEEVVDTLKACAEDIGEPGVDYEFGLGVLSLACERVENAEVLTAGGSLRLMAKSPGLDRLLLADVSDNSSVGFSPFAALRGWDEDTARGHAGATFSLGPARIATVFGADAAPLGVWSSFARLRRTPFAALGTRLPLWRSGGNGVYAVAVHGRETGEVSSSTARAGAQYARGLGRGTFSLYAGHVKVRAKVGIPGHREADVDRVRAEHTGWEARLAYALRF